MMSVAALLLVQPAPSIYSDAAASKAALQIFRDACTEGEIRVPPEKGHVLSDSDAIGFASLLPFSRSTKHTTVIEFNYPRATYLIFADFKHNQPQSIGRECILLSKVISLEDALRAIIWTAPDLKPVRTWIPGYSRQSWLIDAPKRGFRASVSFASDRSIVLKLGTYASSLNNNSANRVNSE